MKHKQTCTSPKRSTLCLGNRSVVSHRSLSDRRYISNRSTCLHSQAQVKRLKRLIYITRWSRISCTSSILVLTIDAFWNHCLHDKFRVSGRTIINYSTASVLIARFRFNYSAQHFSSWLVLHIFFTSMVFLPQALERFKYFPYLEFRLLEHYA